MNPSGLEQLLAAVREGRMSLDEVADQIGRSPATFFRLFLALSFWLVGLLFLIGRGFLAWTLKDGLGPEAIESHGLTALGRFFAELGYDVIVLAIPILLGFLLYPWRLHAASDEVSRENQSTATRG